MSRARIGSLLVLLSSTLFACSMPEATQEVRMSGLSFQLPRAWTVRTDGRHALTASLSATFDPKVMPSLTVQLCDETANLNHGDCFVLTEFKCTGTAPMVMSVHKWPHGIMETRWVCPLMQDSPGVRYSSSETQFEVGKKALLVSYLATDRDTPPTEFLDDFAKSLRPE